MRWGKNFSESERKSRRKDSQIATEERLTWSGMAGASPSVANLNHLYPAPLRYHIDVVMNPETFYETLLSFHSAMRTRNPVLGGEQLDLYLLYFLVTQRGGIEKVIFDGKWKEVIAELNIPHAVTNRSFVVKKHYFRLLFQYEQVYFFRRQGPIIASPVTLRQRIQCGQFVDRSRVIINEVTPLLPQTVHNQASESFGSVPHHPALGENQPEAVLPLHEEGNDVEASVLNVPIAYATIENGNGNAANVDAPSEPTLRVDTLNEAQSSPCSNVAANGHAVSIVAKSLPANIEGHNTGENMRAGERLDHVNNLFTVAIGTSRILHGMLNNDQHFSAANFSAFSLSGPSNAVAPPQPCRSSYNIFFEEKYSSIRNLPPQGTREFVRLIEESWDKLTEDERGVYNERERMDKDRYKRELQEYRERMRVVQSQEAARVSAVERENTR